jgi:hypothetical protein
MEDGASSPAPPNCRTPYCLLRGQAAVDYHSRSGHEARVVERQEHDAERDASATPIGPIGCCLVATLRATSASRPHVVD